MKTNKAFLGLLVCIGVIMIAIGIKIVVTPPILTGVGFFIIAFLFWQLKK
jgi:uncharacterized membrane protein YbaN (DUF454 family)